jgi:hypothetical protein
MTPLIFKRGQSEGWTPEITMFWGDVWVECQKSKREKALVEGKRKNKRERERERLGDGLKKKGK